MSTGNQVSATATCTIAKGPGGRMKLHHYDDKGGRTVLWEPINGAVIETIFDLEGGILVQSLLKIDGTGIVERVGSYMENAGLKEPKEADFSDVKLDKKCPKCGSAALERKAGKVTDYNEVPVMPIYDCASCQWRSYYLTDTYLTYLVHNHKELFDNEESTMLAVNEAQFVKDLKEYIIRIFASKRILCVK